MIIEVIDLAGECVQSAAHPAPDRPNKLARSAPDPRDQDKAPSSAVPALLREVETLAQSAADILVQSGEDLAAPCTVVQPAADLAVLRPDASIDYAIDQLTAELAAFCFDQLEKSVTSRDGVDLNADTDALENEFQVSAYIARGM
jgi:hypothetical protein